jgi:hypothetical protein
LSDLALAITRSNRHGNSVLVIEEVLPTPCEPCVRFLVADVTVAVLYWENAPSPGDEALDPVGWTWFRASAPEDRNVLSGATPVSEAAAIDCVATHVERDLERGTPAVGIADLPAEGLARLLLSEG